MTNLEKLAAEIRHVKAFLEAAEAALSASVGPEDSKVRASSVGIEAASEAMASLTKLLHQAIKRIE